MFFGGIKWYTIIVKWGKVGYYKKQYVDWRVYTFFGR